VLRTITGTTLLALLLVATSGVASLASVISVPDEQPTIQLGIEAAAPGDTVLIAPGAYEEMIDFLGKPVVVGSRYLTTGDPAYVDSTALSGNEVMFGPLVTADTSEDSLSVLAGLTLTQGKALNGAGVYCRGSTPRIADCVFSSNNAQNFGGGIYGTQASPIVEGCRFEDNEAGFSGGGICVHFGSPRVVGNTFTGNVVGTSGGAVFIESGTPVVTDNLIDGNTAYSTYAGGIMSRNNVPIINRNVISNNLTNGLGGGMFY
jgi:predicted outer membrane repeat protein